jgi:hypothetical protein
MPAILRIDVDRAYENRILHYARVNQYFLLEKEPALRKYSQSDCRFIKARWQNKKIAPELMNKRHSGGLHAVHTKGSKDFPRDLKIRED